MNISNLGSSLIFEIVVTGERIKKDVIMTSVICNVSFNGQLTLNNN